MLKVTKAARRGGILAALSLLSFAGAIPASANVTVVPYQRTFQLLCGNGCATILPTLAADTQLNLHRVSCYLEGTKPKAPKIGELSIDGNSNIPFGQFFAPLEVTPGVTLFNQEMDVLLLPQMHSGIYLDYLGGGNTSATCTLTGVRLKFY